MAKTEAQTTLHLNGRKPARAKADKLSHLEFFALAKKLETQKAAVQEALDNGVTVTTLAAEHNVCADTMKRALDAAGIKHGREHKRSISQQQAGAVDHQARAAILMLCKQLGIATETLF